MSYLVSVDYGHGSDYPCVVIAEKRKGVTYIIGEGWHRKNQEMALKIAISTIRPWWKRWLFKLQRKGQ